MPLFVLSFFVIFHLQGATPFRDVSAYYTQRRSIHFEQNMKLGQRLEHAALSSVGYISLSRAPIGFKCADQVSQLLQLIQPRFYGSYEVSGLVELLQNKNWSVKRLPLPGCVLFTKRNDSLGRSHIGVLVRKATSLKESIEKVLNDYNQPGQEKINRIITMQEQSKVMGSRYQAIMNKRIDNEMKTPDPSNLRSESYQGSLEKYLLSKFKNPLTLAEEYTVVHNQTSALRLGPADFDDLLWMAKGTILCPPEYSKTIAP